MTELHVLKVFAVPDGRPGPDQTVEVGGRVEPVETRPLEV
jgi:hypothetical protein